MKQFRSATCKALFLFLLSTGAAGITHAQKELASVSYTANKVQFVGVEGDLLIFDLHFTNLPVQGSIVRIIDGENNEIFEERILQTTLHKRYKIVRNNTSKIRFEISSKQLLFNESFKVAVWVEEKLEVTKAK